jgi:hypothetical protein
MTKAQLERLAQQMGKALFDGYHSGFCTTPCRICQQYAAALSEYDKFLARPNSGVAHKSRITD